MDRKFDTKVQYLKYRVLKEIVRLAFSDHLLDGISEIPKHIVPGKIPTMRCCVFKERAILGERVRMAIGGASSNPNIIEVLDIACDECPVGGYDVTDACRGCIAHHCEQACRRGAITFDHKQKAHIDKDKCVECGMCAKVCPYNAIMNFKRPCERACKADAISMNEDKVALIDESKCVRCGACVYQCPFGAIVDKSFILNVIDLLRKAKKKPDHKVYAIVAPSIASQFNYAKLGQLINGIKKCGFYHVVEVALGADIVAFDESKELAEKGFLLSSCCPAFVDFVRKNFPNMTEHISHNLSPMGAIAKYIKETDPTSKIVFIGPCTAKKMEVQYESMRQYVDAALTFEELQALLDGLDIDITTLEEDVLDNASYYGRIFARSGGLADAVREGLKEHGCENFEYKPVSCNGLEECRKALMIASRGKSPYNFIEGMACVGGCIGGAGCLNHGEKNLREIDKYGREAMEKTITEAVSQCVGVSKER
ncbi:MAG: 4Fe-4S dicluster domain-containing protein [bacterium]|nr:4Fe-4S dicluster domain-containing protein [bacterium]